MNGDLSFSIEPVNFFQFSLDLYHFVAEPFSSIGKRLCQDRYRLPDLASLSGTVSFADVYMGWSLEGIAVHAMIHEPFRRCSYPDVARGDALEIFVDTRDVKTSGFNTRYCHHFFCLPEAIDGHQAGELTHFRTEDAHDWCSADELISKATLHQDSYSLTLFIPSNCLTGYDPEHFDRLGFNYKVNRAAGEAQNFSASSREFQIEQQPSLWASLKLKFYS